MPLVFVGTHTDHIDTLLAEHVLTEAQLDTVQQFLRTVALRYGAALFSTTMHRASTYDAVRTCIRHRLYVDQPVPSTARPAPLEAEIVTADVRKLCIPPGWDTWAKIEALASSFSCAAWDETWANDHAGRLHPTAESTSVVAQRMAECVPPPPSIKAQAPTHVEVSSTAEFLASLRARQPPATEAIPTPPTSAGPARHALGPSMQVSTLDLPAVESALQEQVRDVPVAPTTPIASAHHKSHTPSSLRTESLASPSVATPKQTEVLHSFFQSCTYANLDTYLSTQKAIIHLQPRLHARHAQCSHWPCTSSERRDGGVVMY